MQQYVLSKDNSRLDCDEQRTVFTTMNCLIKGGNLQLDVPFMFVVPMSQFDLDKIYSMCFNRGYLLNKVHTV
jgi:hypothetical protein